MALGPLDERFVTPAWLDVWWSLRLRAGEEPERPETSEATEEPEDGRARSAEPAEFDTEPASLEIRSARPAPGRPAGPAGGARRDRLAARPLAGWAAATCTACSNAGAGDPTSSEQRTFKQIVPVPCRSPAPAPVTVLPAGCRPRPCSSGRRIPPTWRADE